MSFIVKNLQKGEELEKVALAQIISPYLGPFSLPQFDPRSLFTPRLACLWAHFDSSLP